MQIGMHLICTFGVSTTATAELVVVVCVVSL